MCDQIAYEELAWDSQTARLAFLSPAQLAAQSHYNVQRRMDFSFYPLRFYFTARDAVVFPPGKAANVLRGALGTVFRRFACPPECTGAKLCEMRESCPYARLFEPTPLQGGPSGFADSPRPFVFRARHLDGATFGPGSPFHFDLNLFTCDGPALAYFVLAFGEIAQQGLGPRRGALTLDRVLLFDADGLARETIYSERALQLEAAPEPVTLKLDDCSQTATGVRVHFLTPTELKSGHAVTATPEFAILLARIRDRISTLRGLYGTGPLELDFRAFTQHASAVLLASADIRSVKVSRYSTRTHQTHSLGGFVGSVDYRGDVSPFLAYLRVARFTGVGRHTVWGKGEIDTEILAPGERTGQSEGRTVPV